MPLSVWPFFLVLSQDTVLHKRWARPITGFTSLRMTHLLDPVLKVLRSCTHGNTNWLPCLQLRRRHRWEMIVDTCSYSRMRERTIFALKMCKFHIHIFINWCFHIQWSSTLSCSTLILRNDYFLMFKCPFIYCRRIQLMDMSWTSSIQQTAASFIHLKELWL